MANKLVYGRRVSVEVVLANGEKQTVTFPADGRDRVLVINSAASNDWSQVIHRDAVDQSNRRYDWIESAAILPGDVISIQYDQPDQEQVNAVLGAP